jgi:hypothetical protein
MAKEVHCDLDLLASSKIINSPDPVAPGDVVNKNYLDTVYNGRNFDGGNPSDLLVSPEISVFDGGNPADL